MLICIGVSYGTYSTQFRDYQELAYMRALGCVDVKGGNVQHACLEHSQNESHTRNRMDVMHERRSDRRNTKAKRNNGNEPAWANPFAANV